MPLHYRNPHRQGISTTNERRKEETGFPFVGRENTVGFGGFSHWMTNPVWQKPRAGITPNTCHELHILFSFSCPISGWKNYLCLSVVL